MAQKNVTKIPATKQKWHCDICNRTIQGSVYKFNSHLYTHEEVAARHKCSFCSKQYFRKDAYTRHLEVHTGRKKRYVCDHCGRDFVDKRNLAVHLRIHDDSGYESTKYSCMACGVKYCEERLLKYHIRKEHFNLQAEDQVPYEKPLNETWVERVFESDVCVQMTKVNNNVITIKKINAIKKENLKGATDENKRFTKYMNSVFAIKDKSQYSKAVCDYCKKEMLKKSLQNHIRERHLHLRKFKCGECKMGFNRHYQLMNHLCGQSKHRGKRYNKS